MTAHTAKQLSPVPIERAARLIFLLARGHRFTPTAAGVALGVGSETARDILQRLAKVLPLACVRGTWGLTADSNEE